MTTSFRPGFPLIIALFALGVLTGGASAQSIESVGSRALGMGGAFVAVANDSSATWWNPAALAAGPFLDVAIGRTGASIEDALPASRATAWSVAAVTPPFGLSYYRLGITDIRGNDPTAQDRADRQDRGVGLDARSTSLTQVGATILHTLFAGVHVGTTVKYVRANVRSALLVGVEPAALDVSELLDRAEDLSAGDAAGAVDLDVGALAVAGAIRVGAVVRNAAAQDVAGLRLPRQIRLGVAFDGEAVGELPLILSVDADVRTYVSAGDERRVIAAGAEHWLVPRRFAVRGGGRKNTVGRKDGAVTGGASVSPRPGLFVDGHVALGGDTGESGWGVAARVSF